MGFDPHTYLSEKKKNRYSKSNHNRDSVTRSARYAINYREIPKVIQLLYEIMTLNSKLSGWSMTFLNSIIDRLGDQYEKIKKSDNENGFTTISEKQYMKLMDIIFAYRDENEINEPLSFNFVQIIPQSSNKSLDKKLLK